MVQYINNIKETTAH